MRRMFNWMCVVFLIVAAFVALSVKPASAGSTSVVINGVNINFKGHDPIIVKGRMIMPIQSIAEYMGVQASWNGRNMIIIEKNGTKIIMETGSNTAFVNGVNKYLDTPPRFELGVGVMVPIKFVCDTLGIQTSWDQYNNRLNLYMSNVVTMPMGPPTNTRIYPTVAYDISTKEGILKAVEEFHMKAMPLESLTTVTYNKVKPNMQDDWNKLKFVEISLDDLRKLPNGISVGDCESTGCFVLWDIEINLEEGNIYMVQSNKSLRSSCIFFLKENGTGPSRDGCVFGARDAIFKTPNTIVTDYEVNAPNEYTLTDIHKISHFLVTGPRLTVLAVKNPYYTGY